MHIASWPDKDFVVLDEADLIKMLEGKGITEVDVKNRPHGAYVSGCVDQRLAGGDALLRKLDVVYRVKPFVRCVEAPVEVFSTWNRVHVDSLLYSFNLFVQLKGIDTFCIDAHSECAKLPPGTSDVEQLKMMIESFHNLRTLGGLNCRLIGSFTKAMKGRWKTVILFDTHDFMPVLSGTAMENFVRELKRGHNATPCSVAD